MSQYQQGFGCMGFSAFYSSARKTTPEQAKTVIEHAVNNGVVLFNRYMRFHSYFQSFNR